MRLWIKPVEAGEGEQACNLQGVRARHRERCAAGRVDKAAVLAAFLLRESEGAVDGKKRTVRGVARRAAKPSKEAGKDGRALYDGLRERYDLSAFSS